MRMPTATIYVFLMYTLTLAVALCALRFAAANEFKRLAVYRDSYKS